MPHFNQSHAPILSKFRSDEIVNSNMNKYNGLNNSSSSSANNQYSVPYTSQQQSNDDKQRSITSYPQSSHGSTASSGHQPQPPEISQVNIHCECPFPVASTPLTETVLYTRQFCAPLGSVQSLESTK